MVDKKGYHVMFSPFMLKKEKRQKKDETCKSLWWYFFKVKYTKFPELEKLDFSQNVLFIIYVICFQNLCGNYYKQIK